MRTRALDLFQRVTRQTFDSVELFVAELAELRVLRGEIISLKDLRYTNLPLIEDLEVQAQDNAERLSEACVSFLLQEDSLLPYQEKIKEKGDRIPSTLSRVSINGISKSTPLCMEMISGLRPLIAFNV